MPIPPLKRNMNVEIREMINRDPWSLKQPIHLLGIMFAPVAFIYALEFLVIPSSQGHLSTHLRFLVSGACLLTWASTLSRSFAFYCICSRLSGLLMASFLLLYQVVKLLPNKLSSSAVFLYSALIGLTVVSLPYIPGWFEVIREIYAITRKFRDVGELAMVINTRFFETQLGLVAINSKLLLAHDGSIDIGISRVMSWFIRIWAVVLILQSSEDARLAGGALVCVLVVSPLLRMMITRFVFPVSFRRTLMAKLLIMRDAIRDAVGPYVWCLIIFQIYFLRVKEEFVRSYGKSVRKRMKRKMKKRLETYVTVGESVSHFPTFRRIKFSSGKGPGPDARVVYIAGAFDLFHAGHVEILRCARELGDFLLVGIHNDQTVRVHKAQFCAKRGGHHPIMSMQERSLSVGACRYVDEVIIGAPWEVSKNTITVFGISLVVHGAVSETDNFQRKEDNPYAVPISMGIFQILESPLDITTSTIMERIVANHEGYQEASDDKQKEASDDKQKAS